MRSMMLPSSSSMVMYTGLSFKIKIL